MIRLTCRFLLLFLLSGLTIEAQRYLSDYDSSLFFKDTLRPVVKRFENLHISGYIQPQFQVAQSKGTKTFAGGDFSEFSNSRFMLRRARVKLDYILPSRDERSPKALFTFQFEATERDVNVRDMFVRVFTPGKHDLSLSMGLVARPFGYEVNLSSSFRETPERGRASQILMPSERDIGAMITFERLVKSKLPFLKFDMGIFNGQGKSGTAEFDSYKDLISRFYLKPLAVKKNIYFSGGLSILQGGWRQATRYRYEMGTSAGNTMFVVDSNIANIGKRAPREYYGADIQWMFLHRWGKTEVRLEGWSGRQPGTLASTANPGTLPSSPTYIRPFNAAFVYFLQNLFNNKWELMAKYDHYDPNKKVTGTDIGKSGTNLSSADIRYTTFGFGLTRYFSGNLKFLVYYDIVRNEKTALTGFERDIRDNVFTFRTQFRF